MYLLCYVLCLVSFAAALPFSEPRAEDVTTPNDPALDTAATELEIDAQKGEHEEKNDEDREELPAEFTITPPHLIKPPHREVIIELHKVDRYSEREGDPKDKIIPRGLGVWAGITAAISKVATALKEALSTAMGIVQNLPNLLNQNTPARILIDDDVQ